MPDWLERLINRNAGIEYVPLVLCIGGAVALWWWQWSKRKKAGRGVVRVGWAAGVAIVVLVAAAVAWGVVSTGVWGELRPVIEENPWLVAWWVVAAGVAMAGWGVAAHAWRGEGRLARQCRGCRYDMTALPGVMACPECGRVAKNERGLRPVNVRRWALWIGAAVVAVGLLLPTGIAVQRRGWTAALPGRTLLWWACATGSPPMSVMEELVARVGESPADWDELLTSRQEALGMRMLEAPAEVRDLYAALVRGRVSPAVTAAASAAVESADVEQRRTGLALLVSGGGQGNVPVDTLVKLLGDTDPQTARNAQTLLVQRLGVHLSEVLRVSDGSATDTQRLRAVLRAATTGGFIAFVPRELTAPLRRHADAEVSARGTLLEFLNCARTDDVDVELVAATVLAVETVDALGPGQRSPWFDVCRNATPAVKKGMLAAINSQDPRVRRALFGQLAAFGALQRPAMASPGVVPDPWADFRPALVARMAKEADPSVRAALGRLVPMSGAEAP
jgi:hypothetical protein